MAFSRIKIGLSVLFFCMSLSGQAAEIRLKNVPIRCTEPLVTLADVADVLPMGNENVEPLRQTVLFLTPTDGETKTLDQWGLRTMLSQLGFNSLHHSISGAEKIAITGVAVKSTASTPANDQFVIQANYLAPADTPLVTPIPVRADVPANVLGMTDDIARKLEELIAQSLCIYLNHTNKIQRSWDISLKLTPEQIRLFATNGQIADISGGQIPFTGLQQFQIRMQSDITITVNAEVTLPLEVVVVRRTLQKGSIISASDVMLQRIDKVNGDDFFVDIKSVIGKEVIKPVKDLSVLTQSSVRMPFLVCKGEIVTVRAAKGGAVVRTEATSLQDGVEGDTIRVAKIDSIPEKRGKKEEPITYLARVCAPKTVEVFVK